MRNGFLIYEKMRKYFPIYEEAVIHIWLCNFSILNFLKYEENLIFFFISVPAFPCTMFKRFCLEYLLFSSDSSSKIVGFDRAMRLWTARNHHFRIITTHNRCSCSSHIMQNYYMYFRDSDSAPHVAGFNCTIETRYWEFSVSCICLQIPCKGKLREQIEVFHKELQTARVNKAITVKNLKRQSQKGCFLLTKTHTLLDIILTLKFITVALLSTWDTKNIMFETCQPGLSDN
jgi:hypothetical protein